MDPLVWALVGLAVLFVIVVALLVRERNRRRRVLLKAAARSQATAPVRPTRELVDLGLKQREEAIVERRRQMEAAAREASRVPTAPTSPVNPRRMPVIAEPPMEIPQAPTEPAIHPVQKMAIEQWEDVKLVTPASRPKAAPARKTEESFAFKTRRAPTATPSRLGEEAASTERSAPKPAVTAPRKSESDALEFQERPASKKKHDPILDVDWGDIEVRRDVKKR